MSEDNFVRDEEGKIAELKLDFKEWQVKLLEKLKEWFPDNKKGDGK